MIIIEHEINKQLKHPDAHDISDTQPFKPAPMSL